ncbi:olfactory receptor 13G1-like [Pyxicephalus adspersus]|uniref:G-protein coupled receptors family 1 profile domain-containing protein n=1 Tax=Pyxicephalus adspersus TaxID=30357 RepID=A0AAV2ZW30_PYXAD|nr:TPA: hypothetical protein GDO54_013763 [Pyxicephalus adspersus]
MNTNGSLVTEFILLGLFTHPELETLMFILCLVTYTVALTGNVTILLLSIKDPGLNTPMYFFLGLLSFLDIWCTTVTIPKMLASYITQSKVISYYGCALQMFFLTWPLGVELLLLTVMAYDRLVAIGNPLRYASIINHKACVRTAITILVTGLINSFIHTCCTFRLPYCDDNKINHFFCEIMPLLKLACADISFNEIVVYTSDFLLGVCCFFLICVSYILILNTILKINSASGKRKAFSTCASHIVIVSMFYGAVISTYIQPKNSPLDRSKTVSAIYAVITPSLNPIIYSLRNKEVKEALRRSFRRLF